MLTNYVFKLIKGVPRQGINGTGLRLKQMCGFCKARFRSRKERNEHTHHCREKEVS